jgi:hypothetical protein
MGQLENKGTDQWLENFIQASISITSLGEFASALANRLNAILPPNNQTHCGRLGIHLCGFEMLNGRPTPSFFHIHDGPSEELTKRGITVDPTKVNANHDVPPQRANDIISRNGWYITRNGDYRLYAKLFQRIESFFKTLEPDGIIVPWSNNLIDRVDYLIFQIRMVSEIYRLSNLVPGIGGAVNYLTITPDGIKDEGVRYF